MKTFYEIEAGLLPLCRRFIVIRVRETEWYLPARAALDLAVAYYAREGWYEECELEEDRSLRQPRGRELRGVVEVNADLAHHTKESRWSEVARHAVVLNLGDGEIPPRNDRLWWFEEQGGEVTELTDRPLMDQHPRGVLWFSAAYAKAHGIEVPA